MLQESSTHYRAPFEASTNEEKKGKPIGEGIPFQRIRRITGYLVGTIDRFNNAKRQELLDRVQHTMGM